jgi:hypothetical protein
MRRNQVGHDITQVLAQVLTQNSDNIDISIEGLGTKSLRYEHQDFQDALEDAIKLLAVRLQLMRGEDILQPLPAYTLLAEIEVHLSNIATQLDIDTHLEGVIDPRELPENEANMMGTVILDVLALAEMCLTERDFIHSHMEQMELHASCACQDCLAEQANKSDPQDNPFKLITNYYFKKRPNH